MSIAVICWLCMGIIWFHDGQHGDDWRWIYYLWLRAFTRTEVLSVECEVWSGECEVRSAKCEVECEVWSVKSEVRGESGLWG